MEKLVQVAVDAPITEPLTYRLNEEHANLTKGSSVIVPLGKRSAHAVIVGEGSPVPGVEIKSVSSPDFERPQLPDRTLDWIQWLAEYYQHPVGSVAALCFPPLGRGKERKTKRPPVVRAGEKKDIQLNAEQTQVSAELLIHTNFHVGLLFGVTGSGKTEVYMELFAHHLSQGRPCLLLVPEISLTPQLIQRFAARFPDQVAVLHSQLTEREKTNQWWDIVEGRKKILIGARSALFCPVEKWGVIVIDEEHEPSYKQEEKLKYNARDAAIVLAKLQDTPVVLGSATPSLESWHNAQVGRYSLHRLNSRVQDRPMPEVTIVDMKNERDLKSADDKITDLPFWMSQTLYEKLCETLKAGSQAALFLNRRGMAHQVFCEACGHVEECENCAISLTLHSKNHLVCHYCGYQKKLTDMCPKCTHGEMKPLGLGTELIEQDLLKLFPEVKIARADRDEIRSRQDLETLIEQMEKREVQILIGTQMIAKGLDFPGLNLVGVVMADVGLNIPDFRATERSFQLMTQMSGRGGRHSSLPGQTVIQTYNPEHFGIQLAVKHQFEDFAQQELSIRQQMNYPPFGKLMMIRFQGKAQADVERASEMFRTIAESLQEQNSVYASIRVLGPTPAPLSKLNGLYRWHVMLKGPSAAIIRKFVLHLQTSSQWPGGKVRILLDVDPVSLL